MGETDAMRARDSIYKECQWMLGRGAGYLVRVLDFFQAGACHSVLQSLTIEPSTPAP